jgi:ferritin-like metal-binding protein YciE
MSNKIQLEFHQMQFEKHLKDEKIKAEKLNKALETIKLITNNEVSSIDIDALNNFLNDATGFKNVGMSASALNLDVQYQLISDASTIKSDFISLKNGKYTIDENSLKDFYTDWLTDTEIQVYNTLEKALKILNKIDSRYYQCINTTGIDKRKIRAITSVFFLNR